MLIQNTAHTECNKSNSYICLYFYLVLRDVVWTQRRNAQAGKCHANIKKLKIKQMIFVEREI